MNARTIVAVLLLSAIAAAAAQVGVSGGYSVPESQRRAQANFPPVDDRALDRLAGIVHSYHDARAQRYLWQLATMPSAEATLPIACFLGADDAVLLESPLTLRKLEPPGRAQAEASAATPPPDVLDRVVRVELRAPPVR